jgi:hypothetical protein
MADAPCCDVRKGVRIDCRIDDRRCRFVVEPGGELILATPARYLARRHNNADEQQQWMRFGDKSIVYITKIT